jgi:hypothetical protein
VLLGLLEELLEVLLGLLEVLLEVLLGLLEVLLEVLLGLLEELLEELLVEVLLDLMVLLVFIRFCPGKMMRGEMFCTVNLSCSFLFLLV